MEKLASHLLNNSPAKPLLDNLGLLRHRENDRERQALFTRQQTAKLFAERGRQHGHSALHKIDTSRALASITVKGSVRLDEVGDIRNVDSDIVSAILVNLDGDGVIEILGGLGIDSEGSLGTQIPADLELAVGNTTSQSAKCPSFRTKE